MADPLNPGSGFIYMKVGTHADETIAKIVERKQAEIDEAGYALWGYGGNTCHPRTMVQPFARDFERDSGVIYLCMHKMDSRHFAVTEPAVEFSEDGRTWEAIPEGIQVIGSRFALKIEALEEEEFKVPLTQTKVGIGPQMGRSGDRYLKGRVDKACLVLGEADSANDEQADDERSLVQIDLVAKLADPYAVFVRGEAD